MEIENSSYCLWLVNIFNNPRSKLICNRVKNLVNELKWVSRFAKLDIEIIAEINCLKVKCFQFQKTQPHIIEFRRKYGKIDVQNNIQLKALYKKESFISNFIYSKKMIYLNIAKNKLFDQNLKDGINLYGRLYC